MSASLTLDTLVGELLAHVLGRSGASANCILECGAAAFNLGFRVVADLREPYALHVSGREST
jgi:hypothetical protein